MSLSSGALAPRQIGWVDEFGNLFPMAAWVPAKKTWRDVYKMPWQPIYIFAVPPVIDDTTIKPAA